MTSLQDVQSLLRFLSQDAKIPLALALSKIKDLEAANLNTPSSLSKSSPSTLKTIFLDEKLARSVLNAAKRVSKKRSADTPASTPLSKKPKPTYGQPLSDADLEVSLALPDAELDEEKLMNAVIYTNRAPLVLAFAVTLLEFTMPGQPISSRLSLAQAVTSMNSKTKAVSIGVEKGKPAEEEGWGEGQPVVRVMTREVSVMKRWGYEGGIGSEGGMKEEEGGEEGEERDPALWAIDLEALRKANTTNTTNASTTLPIYTAQSARAYLIKALESPPTADMKKQDANPDIKQEGEPIPKSKGKRTPAIIAAEKERNLGLLLGALQLLYKSWAQVLSKEDLDKRAWGWYIRVRPEVAQGAAGWGGKGNVKLLNILALRRPST